MTENLLLEAETRIRELLAACEVRVHRDDDGRLLVRYTAAAAVVQGIADLAEHGVVTGEDAASAADMLGVAVAALTVLPDLIGHLRDAGLLRDNAAVGELALLATASVRHGVGET